MLGHTNINKQLEIRHLPCQLLTYSQCTLFLPTEHIRKSCGFLLFSGDREKVHWEGMCVLSYSQPLFWSLINRKSFYQKLKCKDFQKILQESPYYQDEQNWELQLKSGHFAKFSSIKCDKDLKSGFLCLCVSGTDREECLSEVLFLPRQHLHSCKATVGKHKITGITKDEFVSKTEFNKVRQQLDI